MIAWSINKLVCGILIVICVLGTAFVVLFFAGVLLLVSLTFLLDDMAYTAWYVCRFVKQLTGGILE